MDIVRGQKFSPAFLNLEFCVPVGRAWPSPREKKDCLHQTLLNGQVYQILTSWTK